MHQNPYLDDDAQPWHEMCLDMITAFIPTLGIARCAAEEQPARSQLCMGFSALLVSELADHCPMADMDACLRALMFSLADTIWMMSTPEAVISEQDGYDPAEQHQATQLVYHAQVTFVTCAARRDLEGSQRVVDAILSDAALPVTQRHNQLLMLGSAILNTMALTHHATMTERGRDGS